jgi:hypothetical protein
MAVVIATVAAVGAVAAAPAQAAPTGCATGYTLPNDAWAQCSGGTGSYRVFATCVPFGGKKYGPWRTPNGISWVDCGLSVSTNIGIAIFSPI